ncbi:MAG TPA: tripartite tricarboxylate transporter TctB family protein [Burkholderiales bacterium]|nr:tripartite tricarboxylate transporter TctB family protein [Burkholderiales bacterium]
MTKAVRAWADVAMASALGAYFVYQLAAASRYPPEPALFPRIVGVAGVLLAVAVVVRALAQTAAAGDRLELRRAALAVAAPVGFGLALWLLGYWVASLAALIAFPLLLGFRRMGALVATSAGVTLFFGVVLAYLQVRLPRGLLFERLLGG